ncbi:MAG TPA: HEAT repeat domain-containing protein, partial [Fimbriiglobus sp.]|nr:HEAT repeat domain-containing protein [Fimbriiglobus sp.]
SIWALHAIAAGQPGAVISEQPTVIPIAAVIGSTIITSVRPVVFPAVAVPDSAAVEALGRLLRGGKEPGTRITAGKALIQLRRGGEPVARELTEVLKKVKGARHLETAAMSALADLGPAAKSAVPSLVPLLTEEDPAINKMQLIATLRAIGPEAQAALPGLRKLIDETENPRLRAAAKQAVSVINTKQK